MKKIVMTFILLASISSTYADSTTINAASSPVAACENISNACLTAGFTRAGAENKDFWLNCMKPILLGQSISGVAVDGTIVKACRHEKIKQLKVELKELKGVSSR